MNEQALQDSYNLFVQQGYKDSIDDFKKLIATNPEALNDSYGFFKSQGYNESIEDYKNLMGVGAQPTLKKKEPTTTVSPLAGTSSGLSSEQNLNPFAKNTVGIPQPAKTVVAEETIQPTEGFATAPVETITETIAPVKTKKQELEDILKNVKITEEVPVIKPFDKETEKTLSEGPKSKKTSLAGNYGDNLLLGIGALSKMAASIPESIYDIFAIPQNAVAWATGANSAVSAASTKKSLGIENPLLEAVKREQEFTSKEIETFNKENYESSSVYENIKKGNYGDAFELMGAGIIQSAPVSVAMMYGGATLSPLELTAAGTTAFFEGNYEDLDKENPNMPEIEKTIKALGMAGAETVFSAIGTGTIGQVYKDIIKKEGFEAGKVIFKDGLVQAYKTALKKYGAPIGLLGEGLEEAATQVTQNMISGKPTFEGVADAFIIGGGSGVVFTAPITAAQGIQKVQNLTKDYQAKSTINTILKDKDVELTQVYNVPKADKFTPEQIDIANTDRSRDILRKNLLSQLKSGAITKADAKQSLYVFDKVQQVSNSVKDLNVSSTEKAEVANLLSERNELNTLIQNKEPILAVKEKERINEIENQIVDIIQKSTFNETTKTKEDAIQKQSTDESLLRGEQPEVGLPKVGEGNVQPEGPTAGTTEVAPTQPQEEVTTEVSLRAPEQELSELEAKKTNIEQKRKQELKNIKTTDVPNEVSNFPLLRGTDVVRYIPESIAQKAWEVWDREYQTNQSLSRTKARGGFSVDEMDMFYPNWRNEVPEANEINSKYDAELAALETTQPTTEVSLKTPEQEVSELKGLFGKKQATTDSGISVSDKTTVNNIKTKLANKAKTKIIESAQRGLTTLRSVLPDFDIVIHDNEGSYNAAMEKLNGTQSSKGNFAYSQTADGGYSGRIDINLDKADGRTVAHEIFHGVMLKAFGENPKLFKSFKDRISKVLKDSTNKQLIEFANLYEGDVTYEEYLAELGGILEQQEETISPSTLQKIAAIINEFVSKITNGTLKPFEDIKNTKDIVDFFNTISESIRKGEEINTALFQAMQEGASINIGEPSTISRSQKGEKVKFSKTPLPLSFVTEADKININKLIDDIIAKNQKVWFWMADQLGRGNYYDAVIKGEHYLDAGPSFALDPINRDKGVLWASGLSEKTLSDQIAKADYIFFISGSAEKAKLFNKRVLDLVAERINKKSNFKKFKAAMNGFKKETVELNTIKNALSNVNSFEELANSTKRKEFLISINQIGNLKTTPEGSLKELLNSFNAFVDYNELRDGFYRDNNFTQNDIMLVGKPTKVGGKAPHSTYENAILGEVVGVPDTKIDSWDIMPQNVKDAYTKGNKFIDSKTGKEKVRGELSVAQKAKVIAAETGVVRELKSKSQVDNRKKAIAVANTMGMNDKGFFKRDSNPSQLNNMLRQYGYGVKQARVTPDGFGGGYYLVDEEGKKAIKTPISKAQKIQEGEAPYFKNYTTLREPYIKEKINEAFDNMPFKKFISLFRKHINPNFTRENNLKSNGGAVTKNFSFQEHAGYVIGDGSYFVTEDQFRAFAKDAGIEIPTSKSQKVQEEVEQMQQSIPVPISKAQKGLITLTENDVLKYKRVGIDDKRTAQAMNQIGLSGVKFTKEEVDKKIREELNKLLKDGNKYVINEDSPAITQAIKAEIATLEDEGASLDRIERVKSALDEDSIMRRNVISEFSKAQLETLSQWDSYLSQSDYSDAFKYIILDAVLTHNYDVKSGAYTKRSNKTIRNFTPFDAGTLASIYDSKSKALLKDYVEVQGNNAKNIIGANSMESTKEGTWLKFEGGTNAKDLTGTANKLSQLVQNTYWCTKTNAQSQLRGGDFYVFVTEDNKGEYIPRIAVRMEGDRVGEVRGNASSKQDLEPSMLPVADKFLKESIPNDSGKRWLNSIAYNTKVKEFNKKILNNKISKNDIFEYLDLLKDSKKYSVDYGENGLVSILKENIDEKIKQNNFTEDLKGKVAKKSVDINEETEIFFGDLNASYDDLSKNKNLKVITGNLNFEESEIKSLGNIEFIGGNATFENSEIEDLGKLKSIAGDANFESTKIKSLGNLETIGGVAYFRKSKVEDLGKLKNIGGSVYFTKSNIKSLGNLESIGGDAYFRDTEIEDLGKLKTIKVDAFFRGTKVKSLGNLESIGGDAYFDDSIIEDLGNLKTIGGDARFTNSIIKSLGNLEVINGDASFNVCKLEDLGKLKSIEGRAIFAGSEIKDLANLKTIGRWADFSLSKVKSLGNLESIGSAANFRNSEVVDLGKLKTIGNDADFEDSKIKSLGNLESIGNDAYFSRSIIEDLGKLKTIQNDARFSDSKIKSLGNLESINGYAFFGGSNVESLGKLKYIGGDARFKNSKLKSLDNLEVIGKNADFENSKVEDLGKLRQIDGNVDFINSKVKSLGNLELIGEMLSIQSSDIKDLGKLNFIGGIIYIDNPILEKEAFNIKDNQFDTTPISKAQLTDPITKVVREARAQGFSEEAIKLFLEGEGISASEIESAMSPETPASARVKISEKLSAGFNRMMGEVEGIIEKSKRRNVDQAKITENVISYVMGSKVYENATDVQREKIIRDIKTKFGINLKSAPSVAKLFGTLNDVKKFTLTEKQLYIKRLKELQEGASTAVAAWKQASALMAQEIKALVKSGNITARQGGFIISKFAKINMLSPKSVSRFVDYMGKVFADAEYGAQINTAKGLRSDIKKLSKNKEKNADFRKLADEFINIDPAMVEDIYAYNEMASQIKSSVKGSTLRGEKVKFSDVVSIQDATRYIGDTLRVQDKKILEEQRAEVQELMGIDASDMTPEQLRDLLEGEGEVKVTKYNESIVRSLLDKAFKAYSGVIDEILKTGYDAFYTGEKVELTKNQKTLIKQFMGMDLTVLTPKESLQAVDALANFIQNQSTAKMETVVSDYTGRLNARKLAESGVKAQPLMKYKSKGFGKFLAEQTTTLPILFEKMFKGFNRSGEVMDMMGVTKLINGKSLAQNMSNIIVNDYVRQFFNKKANGEAFNTDYNNVERGIASFMMRNVIGTEQQMQAEFNRRKNLIEESIEVLSKGNDIEKQKGELYQKAYDKIVKDSKTIQEIKSKTDATNLEAINFWTSQWADKYQELSDVSENVYNKILDKDINYSPDRFAKISSDTGEVELANDESAFHSNNGTIYKKETGVLMKAIKPQTLPTNKKNGKPTSYIELSFDKNNSNSMYDALVDMKTASAIRQIEAFENSAEFEKIVPTADDAKILKDRVQLYVRNIRNKSPYSDDQFSKAVRNLNRLAAFGVGQALSGFGQPIKQMVPVLTNTLINAGSIDIMSGFNAAKQKFMSESGYGIANRGVESQAQIESLNKLIDKAPTGNFDKSIKWIEKVNRKYLEFFLVNPDVFIARASWMSYYEKSLKEQGVDPNGVDYNTHELNEKAANYAQRMVDRQQNISDVDLSGKLFASKESANQVLVKMLMPFASFRMNQSARLGADLATLADKTATAEDKKIASKSLAGFGVELATFKIISAGIAITLGTLTKALMGQDEDEEEKDKRINNVIKGQWTGTITDIISPIPVVDKPIQAAVETVSTLLEEGTGLPISTFGVSKSDWTSNLGTFGISAQRATELYDMSMLAATGEYTDDFNKKKTISSESQSQITKLLPFAMLSNMGLAPSEVNTVVKNAVKYAKKNTKSTEEKQQAKENKEERESTKQEKINALRTIIEESNDEAIIKQAKDKIDEVDADSEEKKIIKQENAEEKQAKKKLLVDPDTGEEYDTESDLKRYNKDLWEQNFGEGSDWYESHKEEKEVESLLRKKVQQMKDEEMNYTGRNSDGSRKRFGASGTKKTQRFGSSSKGKVKRFGS